MVLLYPVAIAPRGGVVQNRVLPPFKGVFSVIPGTTPAGGFSVQFNLMSLEAYYQLVFFVDAETVGYGGGGAGAQFYDSDSWTILTPTSSPEPADFSTGVKTADFMAGIVQLKFDWDGTSLVFTLVDQTGKSLWSFTATFTAGNPIFLNVEAVAQNAEHSVAFAGPGFTMSVAATDVINAVTAPFVEGFDAVSQKPVMWAISSGESSNLIGSFVQPDPNTITVTYTPPKART